MTMSHLLRDRVPTPLPHFTDITQDLMTRKLYSVPLASGVVDSEGLYAIHNYLRTLAKDTALESENVMNDKLRAACSDEEREAIWVHYQDVERLKAREYSILSLWFERNVEYADDFDTSWLVTKGEITGTFPKRVARLAAKDGRKIPSAVLQRIGDIARTHTIAAKEVLLDFDLHLDWNDGDFGDEGSCYWGERAGARNMIIDHKGGAIRLWDRDLYGKGRCWFAPHDGGYVLWNSYGPSWWTLVSYARVLAMAMGMSYQKASFTNNGEQDGTLWINGGACQYVNTQEKLECTGAIAFHWEDIRLRMQECAACGEPVDEDDSPMYDDDYYCRDCYDDRFTDCGHCSRTVPNGNTTTVDGDEWCQRCADRSALLCQDCEEYTREWTNICTPDGDRSVCGDCIGNYTTCSCGEMNFTASHRQDGATCEHCEDQELTEEVTCSPSESSANVA